MRNRILALVVKELLSILQDAKSRVVVIAPPILQLIIFGYAATFDLNRVPFAVLDQDRSAASRELLAQFSGSKNFVLMQTLTTEKDIAELVNTRTVTMVVHIHPQFERDLFLGRPAQVQVILDGRNSNTAMIAQSYARTMVERFSQDWLQRRGKPASRVQVELRAWYNPNLESRWFFIPGLVGMITQVVVLLVTALSVAREREQGTFDQLLVTPLKPLEILIGKAMPGLIIGFFEGTVILLLAVFWFGIPFQGSLVTFYTGLFLFLLSGIGVGLMISSLAVTQQQGLMGAFMFLVPAVILSGFATPIANMPQFVQWLTYLNPMRYFLIVVRGVFLEGTPMALMVHEFWPMAVIGLVNLSLAALLFRHRMA